MKKILAWVLVLVMVLGMFAGCKKEEAPATEPAGEVITAQDAIEYLKALYPKSEDAMKTPVNFDRMGIIRIGGIPFTVVWTTDLPEEQIKVIVSEDGATVTLDVNEKCESDTPYVLTATITDEQGNSASTTWNCVLPQAVDMVSLVKEAYALKSGESLPYEATLTGKIVSIDTVYNPEYKNITVTIAVEGAEDMPVQCYRLKGEGAENLAVGNIITVTGTLKNYNGTIEFDAGCMLDAVEQGDAVVAPTDPGEILKAAYKLKKGKALPYPVTLTGKVTSIDKPFDPAYNNISVVITVDGYSKYPILCYRLKGTGAEDIALEDTITVTGIIKNYEGTIEYDAGCMLVERISGGNTAQKPTDDEAKILKDAKKLKPGEKLPYIAILTGQVFSVDEKYSEQYKNITVTIKVNGMRIQCYHMKGDDVQKVKVSDTITVSGQIENYNGVIEFSSPVMTDRKAGNGKLKVELGPVDESKTYYAEMKQATLYENLYLNGQISGSGYLKTTKNPAEAVQIHVEEVSGKGTRFYFMDGETKTYIEIQVNGDKQRPALVTEPTAYWNYDSEYKVYFMDVDGVYCALGTYSTYDTVSATKLGFLSTSNIGKSQFVVKYVTEPSEAPVKPETPELGINYVDAPVVGTAYKFVLDQTSLGAKLGFTGEMANTYYFGTSEELDKMVDVYLEEAEGGYHIYFMKGNTKTYLNVIPRENDATKTNIVMQTKAQNAAPSVYELNTEFKYVKTACAGTEWYLGTYGSNTTISASKTSYISDTSTIGVSQFVTWFGLIGEVTPETPEDPENPDTPVVPDEPVTPPAAAVTELKTGDQVVIFAPAYNKALSATKTGNYNVGVDVTVADGVVTGFGATETFTVTVNADGTYSFANNGQNIGMADQYTSMNLGAVNDKWELTSLEGTLFNIKNVVRGTYMEWYVQYSNWSTYGANNAATDDQFQLSIYVIDKGLLGGESTEPETPDGVTELKTGDQVVIFAPAYNKALSATKTGNYNVGVDVTVADGVVTGFGATETFTVTVNADGTYSFANNGQNIGMADQYTSMNLGAVNDKWELTSLEGTLFNIKNVVRGTYMEWYVQYSNWSTYGANNAATDDQFQLSIYVIDKGLLSVASTTPDPTPDPEPEQPPVNPPATEGGYVKVTDASQLTTGTYVMIVEGGHAPIALDGTWLSTAQPVVEGDVVTDTKNGVWTLTFDGTSVKITDANGVTIKPKGGNNNGIASGDYSWAWTFENGTISFAGVGEDTVKLACNIGSNGGNKFRGYKVSTLTGSYAHEYKSDFTVYKLEEATEPEVTGYIKVTESNELTNGSYVMIVEGGHAPIALDGTWLSTAQPVVEGDVVTDTKNGVWTLTFDGTSVKITDANGVTIKPKGGNNNGIASGDYSWAWTFENGTISFAGVGEDTVKLACNIGSNGGNKFRGYKVSTLTGSYAHEYKSAFTLYKAN